MTNPLTQLHRAIVDHFDLEELRTLCYDLGVNYDDLRGEALSGKARELILKMGRQGQLDELLSLLAQTRPHLPGEIVLADFDTLDELYAVLSSFEDTSLPAPPAPGASPFKGLQYFDQADAHLFFGREALTAKLVGQLRAQRFLAVVGASGSGKSSVVRAGLIPALQRGEPLADGTLPPDGSADWPIHVITPTAHPLKELAASLTRDAESVRATTTLMDDLARDPRSLDLVVSRLLKRDGRGNSLLLVVDQFEELFTACKDAVEHQAFVDNLLHAVAPGTEGATVLVIALRADFYAHCAQYDDLRGALEKCQAYIGPMNPDELRCAIEEPATQGGWEFEPGLVDLLLRDVGGEPGALPLLSHALLETWQRRQGRTLTLAGYHEAGGVHGAIAQTAETVYQHKLTPAQRPIARDIFLRLTELGEGTQDTRRRAALAELVPRPQDGPQVEAVLKTLADARLVTTSEEAAEVAHEALIREWPTLRRWLDENREGLRVHRHLTESAQGWRELNRDPGELYRGTRLAQALDWAESLGDKLNPLEREFLDASQAATEKAEREREATRQRELTQARDLAEEQKRRAEEQARFARRLGWLAATLAVVFLLAVGAAVIAGIQRREAQTNKKEAELKAQIALSRQLAAQAINQLNDDEWELAMLLAIEAGRVADTAEAFAIIRQAFAHPGRTLTVLSGLGSVLQAQWNADESRILTQSADRTVRVWDADTGEELVTLSGSGSVGQAQWNADGSRILTASRDGTARVWDADTGEELVTLFHTESVLQAQWNADESRILTQSADRTVRVWDADTGEELVILFHTGNVLQAQWNADESHILTASTDGTARVWDAATEEELVTLSHTESVLQAQWNADGSRILTASTDGTARVWDADTGEELVTLSGHRSWVNQAQWNADESHILTAGADGTARVWGADTGEELVTLSHTGDVSQ
ncbi:MAG: hypothetical protein PVF45_10560, partial [Anaerolineae bacterium]